MSLTVRRSNERGLADFGWLKSRHTFSFGTYHDPKFMGFGPLRVINDDRVAGGGGFPPHSHRDMEIISYVLEGGLEHKDSLGTGSVVRPGDVQRMTAGTGVQHSEFNASASEPVHFLQVWILPERQGLEPSYEQKRFEPETKRGRLRLIGSRDGEQGSLTVHQDVSIYAGLLDGAETSKFEVKSGRQAWLHVASGAVHVNDVPLSAGDAVSVREDLALTLHGGQNAEVLLFDLARH